MHQSEDFHCEHNKKEIIHPLGSFSKGGKQIFVGFLLDGERKKQIYNFTTEHVLATRTLLPP
jgi:hypothetical protein